MNVLDWIFIAALVVGAVLGLIKGFLKPLLSAIGFVIIAFGSSALAPVVQGWLVGIEMTESFRSLLAIILSIAGLTAIWAIVSLVLRRIITARRGMGIANRVVGAVLGVVVVYLVFAVVMAFIAFFGNLWDIKENFGPTVDGSWIRANIFSDEANFFGNWIIGDMARRVLTLMQEQAPDALVGVAGAIV